MMNSMQKLNNRYINSAINNLIEGTGSIVIASIAETILENCKNHSNSDEYSIIKKYCVLKRSKDINDDILSGIKVFLNVNDDYNYRGRSKIKKNLNIIIEHLNKYMPVKSGNNWEKQYENIMDTWAEHWHASLIQDIY